MSRLLKIFHHEKTGRFLSALLMAVGLCLLACAVFFPAAAPLTIILWCSLFSALFLAYSLVRFRFKGLMLLLLGLMLVFWGLWQKAGPVHRLAEAGRALLYLNSGFAKILPLYADVLVPIACFVLTLTAWGAAADESCFSSALYILAACVLLFLMHPEDGMLLLSLPAFAGFALQLSRKQRFAMAAVPFAALIVALAFFLTPDAPPVSNPLQELAKTIRTAIEDHLLFTQERTSFSLKTEGYQPLDTRLGGKPKPNAYDVMEVETDEALLLRGKTYDFYTGISWEDSLSSKRYLYHSIYNRDLRTTLLGLDKPMAGTEALTEKSASVRFLKDGTTTLFAPAYTRSLNMLGQRMVLYFNTAGELFLTRDITGFDSYTFSYLPLHAGHESTARLVEACAAADDPYYETVAAQYLPLPGHIQQEVFDIAYRAADAHASPYEKALQIQNYLQTHYSYSLDVKTPPENVDFTAYFLLGEKKGYCTYFATAMTVLCRINGIPARYVTGYLAEPDEDGIARVQGKNAHAWTEIYLNGLGWLPIDATGYGTPPENENQNPPPDAPRPTPSPSPSPSPSPEPSPAPSSAGVDAPTPTPLPQQQPSPSPSPRAEQQPPAAERDRTPFWPWLILLLIIALLALRYRQTLPQIRAGRRRADPEQIYFRAMEKTLQLQHFSRQPAQTLHAFAETLAQQGQMDAARAVIAYAASLYGKKEDAAPLLHRQYLACFERLSLMKKIQFRLLCMLGKA